MGETGIATGVVGTTGKHPLGNPLGSFPLLLDSNCLIRVARLRSRRGSR